MKNTQLDITITPKLSQLNSNVLFEFIFLTDYNIASIKYIKAKLILDIVYLNKEIPFSTKPIELTKDNHITYLLDNLTLDQIDENSLFNISSLNFELINQEGQVLIEKVLIVQIIKHKGEMQKHIISN